MYMHHIWTVKKINQYSHLLIYDSGNDKVLYFDGLKTKNNTFYRIL